MEYLNWDWTRMEQPQVGLAQLHYEDFANSAADSGNDEEEDGTNFYVWIGFLTIMNIERIA